MPTLHKDAGEKNVSQQLCRKLWTMPLLFAATSKFLDSSKSTEEHASGALGRLVAMRIQFGSVAWVPPILLYPAQKMDSNNFGNSAGIYRYTKIDHEDSVYCEQLCSRCSSGMGININFLINIKMISANLILILILFTKIKLC